MVLVDGAHAFGNTHLDMRYVDAVHVYMCVYTCLCIICVPDQVFV